MASSTIEPLSEHTQAVVSATIPALEESGTKIIARFYKLLFTKYPVTAGFFNKDRVNAQGDGNEGVPPQVAALAGAVVAYAKHIHDISPILPVVERICHKHVSRNVRGPHYTLVGKCLLQGIQDVLGPEVATEEVADAWGKAFRFLADNFIATENSIREKAENAPGGFNGYKEFKIARVVSHSDEGPKTFTLVPTGDSPGPIPAHRGGQYLSFEVDNVESLGKCKLSAMLSDVAKDKLVFTVFPNGERPVEHLLRMQEGGLLKTSVPCGPFAVDKGDVSGMRNVVIAGKAEDSGMLIAVARDLQAAEVEQVNILVEKNDSYGDVTSGAKDHDIPVDTMEEINQDCPPLLQADGIFFAPSLKHVAAKMEDGSLAPSKPPSYIKIIE